MSRRRQAMKRPTRLGEKYLQVQRLRQLVEQTEKSRAGIANTRARRAPGKSIRTVWLGWERPLRSTIAACLGRAAEFSAPSSAETRS